MNYESTYKESYKYTKEEFEKKYKEKFNSSSTLHFNFNIKGFPAFFTYSIPIFELALSLQEKNSILNSLFNSLPLIAKSQYIRNTLIIEVKNTNELEGVFSSKKEIFEIAKELINSKSNKIGSIVNKYMMLLKGGKNDILSCLDIRRTYEELFISPNKPMIPKKDFPDGKYFRTSSVGVFDATGATLHWSSFSEHELISMTEEGLTLFNNTEINIFIRLALFHFIFEYCHPFYDGNGRIGRYFISLYAKQYLSDIFAFRISAGIKAENSKYRKAFLNTEHPNNRGDLTTFVYDFLTILSLEYDRSIKYANDKKEKLNNILTRFSNSDNYSKNEKRVINILAQAYVFSDFGISLKEISEVLEINQRTVLRAIERLRSNNLIACNRYSKTLFYNLEINEV